MRKFKFSMEKVLEVRRLHEDLQFQKIASIKQELYKLYRQKEQIQKQQMLNRSVVEQAKHERFNGKILNLLQKSIDGGQMRLVDQSGRILNVNRKLEIEREKLIQASNKKKVMENLKNKEYLKYIKKVQRLEQAQTDEIAGLMSFRNSRNEICDTED